MKKIGIFLIVILLVLAVLGYLGYSYINGPNVILSEKENVLTIPPTSSYQDVLENLSSKGFLSNKKSFDVVAGLMKYKKDLVPSGKYLLKDGMSNRELIGKLRSGNQMPINVTFNNMTTIDDLAGQLAGYFFVDSIAILSYLKSPDFLSKQNVNNDNVMSLFIPNTYQMYWDYPVEKIVQRLINERDKFWEQNNRIQKAREKNLSKEQVYTLASIVEKESNYKPERKK